MSVNQYDNDHEINRSLANELDRIPFFLIEVKPVQ